MKIDGGAKFSRKEIDELTEIAKERGLARQRGEELASSYEIKTITKTGEVKWILYSGDKIEYQGKPAVIGTAIDITEKKESEEKLRKSEDEKYQNTRQIAGGVAHEIYNALFPATSSLDKLKSRINKTDPEEIKRNNHIVTAKFEYVEDAKLSLKMRIFNPLAFVVSDYQIAREGIQN